MITINKKVLFQEANTDGLLVGIVIKKNLTEDADGEHRSLVIATVNIHGERRDYTVPEENVTSLDYATEAIGFINLSKCSVRANEVANSLQMAVAAKTAAAQS